MKNKKLTKRQLSYWKGQLNKHNRMILAAKKAEASFLKRAREAGFVIKHPKDLPLTFCGIVTE